MLIKLFFFFSFLASLIENGPLDNSGHPHFVIQPPAAWQQNETRFMNVAPMACTSADCTHAVAQHEKFVSVDLRIYTEPSFGHKL